MKIGYACSNKSIDATTNKYFRLSSYSHEKMRETIDINIDGLKKMIDFNIKKNLQFFRIGSSIIPFASHEICDFDWRSIYKEQLKRIGTNIKNADIRISMHPGQFTLINSPDAEVVRKSISELEYHVDFLDLLGLNETAKIQIHVGGVYGDKNTAIERFIENYQDISHSVKRRLAIENDDTSFSLQDCLYIHKKTGIPIIFDNFHHECLNNNEPMRLALEQAMKTWKDKDGICMVDYSSQEPNEKRGKHVSSINEKLFKNFLSEVKGLDFDIMLEIKDKEKSAIKARKYLS